MKTIALAVALLLTSATMWASPHESTTVVRTTSGNLVTLKGTILELDPGRVVVLRGPQGERISYSLGPNIAVPGGALVGKTVELRVDPSSQLVQHLTLVDLAPGGVAVATATGSTPYVTGVVKQYVPAKTITVASADGSSTTYVIGPQTTLPESVVIGRPVQLVVAPGEPQVVTQVSYAPTALTGTVVRVTPERQLVLREVDKPEVTLALSPGVEIPGSLIGRSVTVDTEWRPDGTAVVKHVVTSKLTPEGEIRTTRETTTQEPDGSTQTVSNSAVTGQVVDYVKGEKIVIREPQRGLVTLALSPTVVIPQGVEVGRDVTLYTEPRPDGQAVVSRVTTTEVTPSGNLETRTRVTMREPDGSMTTAASTTVSGTVVDYVAGQKIVVREPQRGLVTMQLTPQIVVPADVAVGRNVMVTSEPRPDGSAIVTRVTSSAITPSGAVQTTERTTTREPDGSSYTTSQTTVSGTVVDYVAGQKIVVREPQRGLVTLALTPQVSVPADVQVGRNVTLYTEPRPDGTALVSRVVTTEVTPSGAIQTTERTTSREPDGSTVTTKQVNVSGTVLRYTPAKTVTVSTRDGNEVTYIIDAKSEIPKDLLVGSPVQLVVEPMGSDRSVVRVIRYYSPEVPLG